MQINEKIAQAVIDDRQLEIAPRLNLGYRKVLHLVLQQGVLSGGAQASLEDNLLHSLYLLSYQDDKSFWL
ncbi:MAG TPA: hypothetical protein VE844_01020, partial [Gammaproteobacteria bacterium]|nr:hypothetical protein [Gammaproteobacteria bacterium]